MPRRILQKILAAKECNARNADNRANNKLEAFLADRWEDFEALPDRPFFGNVTAKGLAKLCASEAAVEKLRKRCASCWLGLLRSSCRIVEIVRDLSDIFNHA